MEIPAVADVARQREQNLERLSDVAEEARVHADALDALVDLIASTPAPVSRYASTWLLIEKRLRQDATIARKRVTLANDRMQDVMRSIEARENWTPRRSQE
jgi:hypothetical protein